MNCLEHSAPRENTTIPTIPYIEQDLVDTWTFIQMNLWYNNFMLEYEGVEFALTVLKS